MTKALGHQLEKTWKMRPWRREQPECRKTSVRRLLTTIAGFTFLADQRDVVPDGCQSGAKLPVIGRGEVPRIDDGNFHPGYARQRLGWSLGMLSFLADPARSQVTTGSPQ